MGFKFFSLSRFVMLGMTAGVLSGCATHSHNCCENEVGVSIDGCVASASCVQRSAVVAPTKLSAVGYGAPGAYTQYTNGQQKLMAMRAAQVDAYRNLAEQVYGFRVWGTTAVSAFATQSDSVRTYVDAFIRGAKVVNVTSIADGNFEATVELELTPSFYSCLSRHGSCRSQPTISTCVTSGCSTPSVNYYSY